MSETVEFGGWPRPPRWVWVAAGVAVVAILVGVMVTRRGAHHAAASSPPTVPSAVRGSHTSAAGSAARWPSAEGACRFPVYLPQIHLARHHTPVQVAVLVGGTALREVTPGGALSGPLPGLPDRGRVVTRLVSGPGADYAFVDPQCSGYLWVYRIAAGAAHRLGTAAFDLLGGPHHAWAVTYPRHTLLTPLDGGRTVTLKAGTDLVADTVAGLVVYHPRAGRPGALELVDPNTGALVRRLAGASPLGAAGGVVLVSLPGCGAPLANRICTLESISLTTGQPTATFELPAGRVPVSAAVFSPSGTVAAFQLARARSDPRFTAGHPSPPADVVVLHLHTGRLDIVPGLELPPGTGAGLAFGTTGNWLLATVSEGNHGELLAWRQGMPGPALLASLPGPLMEAPPLLPLPPSRRNG